MAAPFGLAQGAVLRSRFDCGGPPRRASAAPLRSARRFSLSTKSPSLSGGRPVPAHGSGPPAAAVEGLSLLRLQAETNAVALQQANGSADPIPIGRDLVPAAGGRGGGGGGCTGPRG